MSGGEPAVPLSLDNYALEATGSGATAEIYLARPAAADAPRLTVKLLHAHLVGQAARQRNLRREYATLRSLPPGNFPSEPRFGTHAGRAFIAYRHIDGESLLGVLRHATRQPLSVRHVCLLMDSLLAALETLHHGERRIVHGDISPENVLVSGTAAYLIDFGCATVLEGGASTHGLLGKASYLSPEQARAQPWDERSDLYQAGILFHELLSRRRYNRGGASARVWASAAPPPPLENIPVALHGVVSALLEPSPERRCHSATESRAVLAAAMRQAGDPPG